MDNFSGAKLNLFIVLVSFLNKIADSGMLPETYIIPSSVVRRFLYQNPKRTRRGIQRSMFKEKGKQYLEAWRLIS